METDTLKDELSQLLNKHSRENASNTPDFLLAEFMLTCLAAFEHTSRSREEWFGRFLTPGGPVAGGKFGDEKLRSDALRTDGDGLPHLAQALGDVPSRPL